MNTNRPSPACGFVHPELTEATHTLYGMGNRFIHACDDHTSKHGEVFIRAEPLPKPVDIELVSIRDLRTGQTVRYHGARLVIDQPIDIYHGRPGKPTIYMTRALIGNYDELAAFAAISRLSIAADIVRKATDRRYLIAGSKGSTWTREVPARH